MPVLVLLLGFSALASQVDVRATPRDDLGAVKALYAAADYEGALKALSAQDEAGSATDQADQYRALCLLALGRMDEVELVLESVVVRNPAYRMSDADVPPRLVAVFQKTRGRLLPGILNDSFDSAKAAFNHGRYAEASSRFRTLLTLLDGEDGASGGDATFRRDLARIAEGFLDLAEHALARAAVADVRAASVNAAVAPAKAGKGGSSATPGTVQEEAAIGRVVLQYAQAYSALDADAVARVFQGASSRPLQTAFDALKSQAIEARNVKIAIDAGGRTATVKLTWVVEAIPKVGATRKAKTPATLRMLKSATDEWRIVERR